MFKKRSLQNVWHSSGYSVKVADRFHVTYEDGDRKATAEVEFGPTTYVFVRSLTHWEGNAHGLAMEPLETVAVAERIKAGLEAMGDGAVDLAD